MIFSAFSCEKKIEIDKKTVFRYNETKNINSLDPIFAKDLSNIKVINQLFNGLVDMNSKLEVIPSIAKSWNISSDGKVYTFILRNDVFFHPHPDLNERNVKAKDFEYSFKRLIDPNNASPGKWVFDKVDNFKAINDTVFKITLNQPFIPFLGILTMKYCSVVPKEVVESKSTEFRSSPVGTGPFKFKRWEENIKLVLRKNNKYFEKDQKGVQLPYLEAVSITFFPEKQSEFLQLIKDEIDMISGIDNSFKDEILEINGDVKNKYKESIKMLKGPFLNTEYLAFFMNSIKKEVQSPLIRKAINIGFDKNKMIKFLRNGIGKPANGGIIPIGLKGYKLNENNLYDPEKAKEYIDEYKKITNEIPSLKLTTSPEYVVFCEFIQKELEKIGLNISIEVIPGSSLREAKANGKLDFFRASWVADYPSAENYLSLFYSKNLSPNGPNYTHFKDNFFDSMYNEIISEKIEKNNILKYQILDSIVNSRYVIVPLFYDEVVRFISKNITGMELNAINTLDLKRVERK